VIPGSHAAGRGCLRSSASGSPTRASVPPGKTHRLPLSARLSRLASPVLVAPHFCSGPAATRSGGQRMGSPAVTEGSGAGYSVDRSDRSEADRAPRVDRAERLVAVVREVRQDPADERSRAPGELQLRPAGDRRRRPGAGLHVSLPGLPASHRQHVRRPSSLSPPAGEDHRRGQRARAVRRRGRHRTAVLLLPEVRGPPSTT
jgi:hypothetical protein